MEDSLQAGQLIMGNGVYTGHATTVAVRQERRMYMPYTPKYEYKKIIVSTSSIEDVLNDLGEEGWRLVTATWLTEDSPLLLVLVTREVDQSGMEKEGGKDNGTMGNSA